MLLVVSYQQCRDGFTAKYYALKRREILLDSLKHGIRGCFYDDLLPVSHAGARPVPKGQIVIQALSGMTVTSDLVQVADQRSPIGSSFVQQVAGRTNSAEMRMDKWKRNQQSARLKPGDSHEHPTRSSMFVKELRRSLTL
jgi:hypothetical protein